MNSSFKWLYYASKELNLVNEKDLSPVKELLKKIPDMPEYSEEEGSETGELGDEITRGSILIREISLDEKESPE